MNKDMKEISMEEMGQATGGSIFGLLCVLGTVSAAIGMAVGIGYALKDTDTEVGDGLFV